MVSGVVVYRIKDIVATMARNWDVSDTLNDISMVAITKIITTHTLEYLLQHLTDEVQEKLMKACPNVVLENCAGGGHMKDFGAVKRTHYVVVTDTLSNLTDRQGVYDSTYALPPLGMTQVTQVVRDLGVTGDLQNAQLLLSTSTPGGAFAAYASVIDRTTNDPRTLLPR